MPFDIVLCITGPHMSMTNWQSEGGLVQYKYCSYRSACFSQRLTRPGQFTHEPPNPGWESAKSRSQPCSIETQSLMSEELTMGAVRHHCSTSCKKATKSSNSKAVTRDPRVGSACVSSGRVGKRALDHWDRGRARECVYAWKERQAEERRSGLRLREY
jgi:hypothetical protein